MKVELKYVPVSLVDFNEGQLEDVPANPRTREDSRQEKLAESIEELPEMSEARPPMVLPRDGRYIVIGGNRRLEAFRDLNREEMPVVCAKPMESRKVSKVHQNVLVFYKGDTKKIKEIFKPIEIDEDRVKEYLGGNNE